jgi:ribonuclease HII
MMISYHDNYPNYNFAQNKGYGTREHRAALARFGSCPLHRQTFRGVRANTVDQTTLRNSDQQYKIIK